MPRNDPIDAMAALYDELKKFDDDDVKKNKEHNALLDAEQAKEAARQEKRKEASATTKQERSDKRTKAGDEFIQKHKEFKQGSLKAYDNFVAAMMEIAGLVQAWGKSINADTWALLAGPALDLMTSTIPEAAAAAIASARRVSEYELAAVLTKTPLEMVRVTAEGDLEFDLFKNDTDVATKIKQAVAEGKKVPEYFLENADQANRAAMMLLVRSAGYEFDSVQGGFKHEDKGLLTQDNLASLVQSANFEALIGDALENYLSKGSAPAPGM